MDGLGDAPTIQAGIDSAAAGDTVLVRAGRYVENIDFLGKAIVVRGEDRNTTVIDGSSIIESCVRFMNGEGRGSILEGFTLTGGRGHPYGITRFGGGAFVFEAQPIIKDNIITGNSANVDDTHGMGGGIYCGANAVGLSPLIVSNIISSNSAGVNGGGISIEANPAPLILDNTIENNTTGRGDGGGIAFLITASGAVVKGNVIRGNQAADHGGGIHAALSSSVLPDVEMEISGNVIVDNLAIGAAMVVSSGGGIWIQDVSAWVHHNTIAANEGQGPTQTYGGNVAIVDSPGLILEQNIIALAVLGGGVRCDGTEGPPMIRNNLAWMNAGGDGVGDCADWTTGNGNLVADPYFCDAAGGNYQLAANSPALTHPAGPLGAFAVAGCGPVDVRPITWGQLKSRYH